MAQQLVHSSTLDLTYYHWFRQRVLNANSAEWLSEQAAFRDTSQGQLVQLWGRASPESPGDERTSPFQRLLGEIYTNNKFSLTISLKQWPSIKQEPWENPSSHLWFLADVWARSVSVWGWTGTACTSAAAPPAWPSVCPPSALRLCCRRCPEAASHDSSGCWRGTRDL